MVAGLTAVTPYSRLGGSSRVRVHEWVDRIPEIDRVVEGRTRGGHWLTLENARATAASLRDLRSLAAESEGERGLLVHREVSTLGQGVPERRLLERATLGVYDFDDALYEDHGTGLRSLFPKARIARTAVQAADRVIAANDHLADWASRHAREVVVIPSCIDPSQYRTSGHDDVRPSLVWLGSHTTSKFLLDLRDVLRALADRHDLVLRAIGADPAVGSIGDFVEIVPWQPGVEATLCDLGSVGIMPMPDTPYARGKAAYKLLQYSAAGLPSVSSDVGASGAIARRIGAAVVATPDEWLDELDHLLGSEDERRTRGRVAQERVQSEFSYERWLGPFREALGLSPEASSSASR